MDESVDFQAYIDNPLTVAALVEDLGKAEDGRSALGPEELSILQSDTTPKMKNETFSKIPTPNKSPYVPRGEGPSGNPKVPPITVEEQISIEEPEEVTKSGLGCSTEHDYEQMDRTVPKPESINSLNAAVVWEDLNIIMSSIEDLVRDRIHEAVQPLRIENEKLKTDIQDINRSLVNLTHKVSGMQLTPMSTSKMTSAHGPMSTISSVMTSSNTMPDPNPVAGGLQPAPISSRPREAIIRQFVQDETSYPKIVTIRKMKLRKLAALLRSPPPNDDLPPGEWNFEGINNIMK